MRGRGVFFFSFSWISVYALGARNPPNIRSKARGREGGGGAFKRARAIASFAWDLPVAFRSQKTSRGRRAGGGGGAGRRPRPQLGARRVAAAPQRCVFRKTTCAPPNDLRRGFSADPKPCRAPIAQNCWGESGAIFSRATKTQAGARASARQAPRKREFRQRAENPGFALRGHRSPASVGGGGAGRVGRAEARAALRVLRTARREAKASVAAASRGAARGCRPLPRLPPARRNSPPARADLARRARTCAE